MLLPSISKVAEAFSVAAEAMGVMFVRFGQVLDRWTNSSPPARKACLPADRRAMQARQHSNIIPLGVDRLSLTV